MPHLTTAFIEGKPILDVIVSVSGARLHSQTAANRPHPSPQHVRGLVDTGASHTCIDPDVLKSLSLEPKGTVQVLTPAMGKHPMRVPSYDIGFILPNGKHPALLRSCAQSCASAHFLSSPHRDFTSSLDATFSPTAF